MKMKYLNWIFDFIYLKKKSEANLEKMLMKTININYEFVSTFKNRKGKKCFLKGRGKMLYLFPVGRGERAKIYILYLRFVLPLVTLPIVLNKNKNKNIKKIYWLRMQCISHFTSSHSKFKKRKKNNPFLIYYRILLTSNWISFAYNS